MVGKDAKMPERMQRRLKGSRDGRKGCIDAWKDAETPERMQK